LLNFNKLEVNNKNMTVKPANSDSNRETFAAKPAAAATEF
jgi:hypothetical protein